MNFYVTRDSGEPSDYFEDLREATTLALQWISETPQENVHVCDTVFHTIASYEPGESKSKQTMTIYLNDQKLVTIDSIASLHFWAHGIGSDFCRTLGKKTEDFDHSVSGTRGLSNTCATNRRSNNIFYGRADMLHEEMYGRSGRKKENSRPMNDQHSLFYHC